MKVSVETLLEPLSPENPCGEKIEYDPQFLELETMLQGKEETQFAAAEEPDWRSVTKLALELFQRSKDLRVAVRLALGLLRTEGLTGFRDGLLVIKGLIELYWEPVHPQLDPDDDNDPLERVNIISSLTTAKGTFGDPLQFIKRLRLAPLSDSSQLGLIRMVDVERATAGVAVEGEPAYSVSQIQGGLNGTPPEKLKETYDAIVTAEVTVKELDNLFTKAVGASKAVSFDALSSTLKELQKTLAPYAGGSAEAAPADEPAAGGAVAGGAAPAAAQPGISGAIRSHDDVTRVIDQICDYFKRTEPSSPVPLILQRARRLVNLDFMELLNDLAPDSLAPFKSIAGIKDGQ